MIKIRETQKPSSPMIWIFKLIFHAFIIIQKSTFKIHPKPPGSPIFRRAKREILTGKSINETSKKVNFYVHRRQSDSEEEIELEKLEPRRKLA